MVGTTPYPAPRRIANGVDTGRVLQILAVLEKRIGLNLSKQDVYVNVIGGIDVNEPAADLGIALAIVTCVRDVVFDPETAIIGEIGLSGEIRAVNHIEKRINEAQKLGFKRIIIPESNDVQDEFKGIQIIKKDVTINYKKDRVDISVNLTVLMSDGVETPILSQIETGE